MKESNKIKEFFRNKKVLITGGLGFIGSNLAMTLVNLGAKITLVDAMLPECGGNIFNIKEIKSVVDKIIKKITTPFFDII